MYALTQIPLGTQVLLGEKARLKRRVEMMVTGVFEGWSYDEIIPPIFDYLEVFERGVGAELGKKMYRFLDREGNILSLRPEFTSLVAKTVACRMGELPKPIRLYYSGEVLRYESPRGGQQREFSQIGLEHIGGSALEADVEVLAIAMEVLTHLGLKEFQINLGHMEYFAGIADRIGCEPAVLQKLRELIDIKDKTALRGELRQLNLKDRRKDTLLALPDLTGGREVLHEARKLVTNERSQGALDHLERIVRTFSSLGFARHLTLDLSEVRGLEYYTGMVFRIFVPGIGFEIGGGGRYDKLFSNFGASWRAVGFSFSMERLMQCARIKDNPSDPPLKFRVTPMNLRRRLPEILKARRSGRRVKLG